MASRPFPSQQITDNNIGHQRSQLRSFMKMCHTHSRYDGSWPGIAVLETRVVQFIRHSFHAIESLVYQCSGSMAYSAQKATPFSTGYRVHFLMQDTGTGTLTASPLCLAAAVILRKTFRKWFLRG